MDHNIAIDGHGFKLQYASAILLMS